MKIRTRWRDGSVEIIIKGEILLLKFLNNSVEFRPRSISIENSREHYLRSDSKKKYIYVYFPEELKPLPFQPSLKLKDIDSFTVENYEFRYTRASIDEYYTIVTPGTHLYDYVILTSDELGIVLSGKREVYFDETSDVLTIYLV